MNDENLIPINKRTEKEAREISQKGGKASAKKRAEKRLFRELVEAYDRRELSDEENEELAVIGIDKNDRIAKMRRVVARIKRAEGGDVTANKLLLEIMGEADNNGTDDNDDKIDGIIVKIVDCSGGGDTDDDQV